MSRLTVDVEVCAPGERTCYTAETVIDTGASRTVVGRGFADLVKAPTVSGSGGSANPRLDADSMLSPW